jgi:hypothetical protein
MRVPKTKGEPIIVDKGEDVRLNGLGLFYQHQAMHDGRVPMRLDEFGRCARCIELKFWEPDA